MPSKLWLLAAPLYLISFVCIRVQATDRPLIGILSQPGPPAPSGFSYIAASYVKQIEASGARAVPIDCTSSSAEIETRFNAVNGIVIPGGGQKLKPGNSYYDATRVLVDLAKAANDKGDYFPGFSFPSPYAVKASGLQIHGVCLGLEVMSIILASQQTNSSVLSIFDAENYPSSIQLTGEASTSRMFAGIDKSLLASIQAEPIVMENHVNGLTYDRYLKDEGLRNLFIVTSLAQDRNGKIYIASMESGKYPFSATQFHPEKNAFEWTTRLDIPHSATAVEVSHIFGNFIVREARKNKHQTANKTQETNLLISNTPLIFTGASRSKGVEVDFDEAYFFPIQQ